MKKEASDFKETPGPLQKKLRAVGVTIASLIFVIVFPFILYLLFRFIFFHESLIHIVAKFNNYTMMEMLLKNGADPNTKSKPLEFTPLHFASQKGNVPIMKLLIQHGADLNPVDMDNCLTPIHYAISSDNKDAVQLLIDKGAEINPDINKVRSFPLDYAKKTRKAVIETQVALVSCLSIRSRYFNYDGQFIVSCIGGNIKREGDYP